MRTKVFLTPAAHGKAGEVVAIEYNEEARQLYAPPVPYWSANDQRKRETGIGRDNPPRAARQSVESGNNKALSWDAFLADLDERLAKRALDALIGGGTYPTTTTAPPSVAAARHNNCCTGRYLCTKCQAEAAATA